MDKVIAENIRDAKEAMKHDIGAQITMTTGIYRILHRFVSEQKEMVAVQKVKKKAQDLDDRRQIAANNAFCNAKIPEVKDSGPWNVDGDYWSRLVYWEGENDGPSVKGDFGIHFKEGSTKIIDTWHQ